MRAAARKQVGEGMMVGGEGHIGAFSKKLRIFEKVLDFRGAG